MRTYASLSAVSALALLSASTDAGAVAQGVSTPQTADEKTPAEPQTDPQAQAPSLSAAGDPSPPATPEKALDTKPVKAKGKKAAAEAEAVEARDWTVMVWAQPGHETLPLGKVIRVPTEQADNLRGVGRARYASEAEIEADGPDFPELEGI